MNSETELKPCPFCGGVPKVKIYPISPKQFSEKYSVLCEYTGLEQGCGAEGQHNKILGIAIECWNQRTTDSSERENQQLRDGLKGCAEALIVNASTGCDCLSKVPFNEAEHHMEDCPYELRMKAFSHPAVQAALKECAEKNGAVV